MLWRSGAKPFEQQQFGTAGVEGVNPPHSPTLPPPVTAKHRCDGIPGDIVTTVVGIISITAGSVAMGRHLQTA